MAQDNPTRFMNNEAENYSDSERGNKPKTVEKAVKACNIQDTHESPKTAARKDADPNANSEESPIPGPVIASDIDAIYEIIRSDKVDKTRYDAATSLLKLIEYEQHINHETIAELYTAETDVKVAATLKRALNKLQIRSRLSSDPTQPYDRILSKTEQADLQLEINRLRDVYDKFYNRKGAFEKKYELQEKIAEGGMARIFKALRREDNQLVVVKLLLLEDLSRAADRDRLILRFQREGELLTRRLNHAHIVKGYEYGEKGGEHFIILEYVAGGTLEDLIKMSTLSFQLFSMIARQLCDVVGYLHRKGVIHRDIKPSNVLIGKRQTNLDALLRESSTMMEEDISIKLADFGLAKDKRDPRLSRFSFTAGTDNYASPQQLTDARDVDERDDIYSLGKTFYEMLTGRCLKNDEPYQPVELIDCTHSEAVNALILKCIAQERRDRWQSIAELETAIRIIK